MKTTQHARARSQQRSIPQLLIDLLGQFGIEEKAKDGAVILFFDKAARRKVKAYVGPTLACFLEEHLDVYVIVSSDDEVITVGHRLGHIRRH